MLLAHIALVSQTKNVDLAALVAASAAIQKQVVRDLGPLWEIQATVDAFTKAQDVPMDYWTVTIMDDIPDPAELGFHKTAHNQPYALVAFDDDWTITLSHEVLEMLADPAGDRLIAGTSLKPNAARVNYLVEICDPVQAANYKVNEISVCDFVTPHYFDPVAAPGVRYSFTGGIIEPRQVMRGGYVSFYDPGDGHWWQQRWFDGSQPTLVDVGPDALVGASRIRAQGESLRGMIDRLTPSKARCTAKQNPPDRDARTALKRRLKSPPTNRPKGAHRRSK